MATQTEGSPAAQIVGNAFVQQYYSILHQSPEDVHKFYQESSMLGRPGPDGVLTSVTTMQGINDNIVSMDYKNYKVEILTADAQCSFQSGLVVLVTGYLTGKDNLRRKFSQTFFLAPQANGYFVLNDLFRYVDEHEVARDIPIEEVIESAPASPMTPDPAPINAPNHPVQEQSLPVEDKKGDEVSQILENGNVVTTEKSIVSELPVALSQNDVPPATEAPSPSISEDTPKKSFASVVNALKQNAAPFHVRVFPVKPPAAKLQLVTPPEVPAPTSNNVVVKSEEPAAKTYAIFVPNLPMTATVEELQELFSKFGSIKTDGIQVRSNKGSCFGFVEFESATSMQDALKASPITFVNRKLFIEERRANNDNKSGGRFPSGRGGYRGDNNWNENYRGRGNFSGGRGQGRDDFGRRGGAGSTRPRGNFEGNGPRGNFEGNGPRGNFEGNGQVFQKMASQNSVGRFSRETVAGQ